MVASCSVASSQSRRKLCGRAKGLPPDRRRLKAALLMAALLNESLRACKISHHVSDSCQTPVRQRASGRDRANV